MQILHPRPGVTQKLHISMSWCSTPTASFYCRRNQPQKFGWTSSCCNISFYWTSWRHRICKDPRLLISHVDLFDLTIILIEKWHRVHLSCFFHKACYMNNIISDAYNKYEIYLQLYFFCTYPKIEEAFQRINVSSEAKPNIMWISKIQFYPSDMIQHDDIFPSKEYPFDQWIKNNQNSQEQMWTNNFKTLLSLIIRNKKHWDRYF